MQAKKTQRIKENTGILASQKKSKDKKCQKQKLTKITKLPSI